MSQASVTPTVRSVVVCVVCASILGRAVAVAARSLRPYAVRDPVTKVVGESGESGGQYDPTTRFSSVFEKQYQVPAPFSNCKPVTNCKQV